MSDLIAEVREFQAACGIEWTPEAEFMHKGLTEAALADQHAYWKAKAGEVLPSSADHGRTCNGGTRLIKKRIVDDKCEEYSDVREKSQ